MARTHVQENCDFPKVTQILEYEKNLKSSILHQYPWPKWNSEREKNSFVSQSKLGMYRLSQKEVSNSTTKVKHTTPNQRWGGGGGSGRRHNKLSNVSKSLDNKLVSWY